MNIGVCAIVTNEDNLVEFVDTYYNLGFSKVILLSSNSSIDKILYAYLGIGFVEIYNNLTNLTTEQFYQMIYISKESELHWILFTTTSEKFITDVENVNELFNNYAFVNNCIEVKINVKDDNYIDYSKCFIKTGYKILWEGSINYPVILTNIYNVIDFDTNLLDFNDDKSVKSNKCFLKVFTK